MSLAADLSRLIAEHHVLEPQLRHAAELIDIYEGNLLEYVEAALKSQLKPKAAEQAGHRIAPINLLVKIVDKLSPVYTPPPARRVVAAAGGAVADADQKLLDWYVTQLDADQVFGDFVRALTLCKSAALYPFVHRGQPLARVTRNDRFFVYSSDVVNPLRPTHYVTFAARDGGMQFTAWSDEQVLIFDEKEEVDRAAMDAWGMDGTNPYGRLPVVYRSASRQYLMPKPDSDVLRMTKLLPVMLSDLNYAAMFQCFSILYGIDVDDQGIEFAPNAFMRFRSNPETDKKPTLGQIKPTVDIDQVLGLIQTQIALWLNARGIRPGAVGQLSKDNFQNGISKMIDEMDTFELRQKLVGVMIGVEREFWDLVMHTMHPIWVRAGLVPTQQLFSAGASVDVVFSTQGPMSDRAKLVADLKAEREAGFTTLRRCLAQLNPLLSEKDLDELEAEVRAAQPQAPAGQPATGTDPAATAADTQGRS